MVLVIRVFKSLFTAEFIFSLFLLAGWFKEAIRFPIDLTLLFLLLSVASVTLRMFAAKAKIHKYSVLPIILFSIIFLGVLTSLLYTPSRTYAPDKFIRFAVITGWCFLGPFFIFKTEESLKKFYLGYLILALALGITSIKNFIGTDASQLGFVESTLGTNYIQLGRSVALGSLIFLSMFIYSSKRIFLKLIYLACSLLLVLPLLFSGGRLPLIAYIISVLCVPLFFTKVKNKSFFIEKKIHSFFFYLLTLTVVGSLFLLNGLGSTLLYRLKLLFTEAGGGASSYERIIRISTAIEMIKENFVFGQGFGSFPIWHSGIDAEDTPHNIFLEYFAEVGIVPTLCFSLLIFMAIRNGVFLYRKDKLPLSEVHLSTILIFVFLFITINISGSINGSKIFYPFISIMIMSPYIKGKTGVLGSKKHNEQSLKAS